MAWMPEPENRKRLYLLGGGGAALAIVLFFTVYLPFTGNTVASAEPELAEVNQQARDKDLEGLKRSVGSSNRRVSARAVQAYAQASGPQGASTLRVFMNDPRPEVRAEAVGGWAYVGSPRDIQPVTRAVTSDASPMVRSAGLQALAKLKAWDGLPVVLDRMADDADPSVRRTAMATFEQVACLQVGGTYDPDQPIAVRRAALGQYRRFVAQPAARTLYADWVKRQEADRADGAGS